MTGTVAAWRGDLAPARRAGTRRYRVLRAAGRAIGDAWRDGESFYDLVVLLSVALFFLLAIGVGLIALQSG